MASSDPASAKLPETPGRPPQEPRVPPSMAERLSRGFEPVTIRDWTFVGLAVVSIVLLVARDVYGGFLPPLADQLIVAADLSILLLFAGEFVYEIRRASNKVVYARNHWYEIVGMVPIAHWGLRAFRLVRLLRMYVVERYPEEVEPERDWSYALVRGLIMHYRNVLLEEITDPIIMTSLNVIEDPLARAEHAKALGASIRERRENIHAIVLDSVTNTKGLRTFARTRYGQDIVRAVTESTLETTIHTLESEELNKVISDSIREVLDEVRSKVREKSYALETGSRFHPTFTE